MLLRGMILVFMDFVFQAEDGIRDIGVTGVQTCALPILDKIVNYAEHHILNESEAGFNLTIFYGKDADWTAVVNACRRYPMFAERQVVLLKEAQHMKQIEMLEGYIENPLTSTVLVVAFKEKKIDGRTSFGALIKKKTQYVESKKMYDSKLPEWTRDMIHAKGFEIKPQALQLLI